MSIETTNEFVITREFSCSRKLLFDLWTIPSHLEKWWGPAGLSLGVEKIELKPGGIFHYSMKTPDGNIMYGKFIYREIVAPEKLVFVASFSDQKEGIARHPMSDTWPLEVLSTLVFTENEGKTTLTMTGVPINANAAEMKTFFENVAGLNQGWAGTFTQLDAYLATMAS
jgi:uncharacterized protein YndB with AHSA1/START domain